MGLNGHYTTGPLWGIVTLGNGAPLMVIYMKLNLIEERVYVGQTNMTVADRFKLHDEAVKGGHQDPLHKAMRRWPENWAWTYVVLQNCYSQEELNAAEDYWIEYTCCTDPMVGYNVQRTSNNIQERYVKSRAPVTEEQREFYRIQGKKGAAHGNKGSKQDMSEEEREKFREYGRKGAEKSKRLQAERKAALEIAKVRVS